MKWLIYSLLTLGLLMILGTNRAQELSQDEIRDLQSTHEEQKMAPDLYQKFYMLYNQYVFDRITDRKAEQMQKVKSLLDVYGLLDPIAGITGLRGAYNILSVQQDYDYFYALRILSLNETLGASAQVEEQNINTNKHYLIKTENLLLRRTHNQLIRSSEENLQSFIRNLEMVG